MSVDRPIVQLQENTTQGIKPKIHIDTLALCILEQFINCENLILIVDYPISSRLDTFLSYNAKFCKRCENMYAIVMLIHTLNIHIMNLKVAKSDST